MPNAFEKLPAMEEASRRKLLFEGMSFRRYDFWRWHGISPELATIWGKRTDLNIPNLYELKETVDNASHSGFQHTIGLKGTEMQEKPIEKTLTAQDAEKALHDIRLMRNAFYHLHLLLPMDMCMVGGIAYQLETAILKMEAEIKIKAQS